MAHRSPITGRFISNSGYARWYAPGAPKHKDAQERNRSAAAHKGWVTRRKHQRQEQERQRRKERETEQIDDLDYIEIGDENEPEEYEASGQYEEG